MKLFFSIFLTFLFSLCYANVGEDYIEMYHEIAVREMNRSNIPASITLAQGMLESDFGRGELAINSNNHFGLKCGGNWKGGTYYMEDDDKDHKGKLIKSCFRSYENAFDSYIAHTDFLLNPKKEYRYGFLFEYESDDYMSWAIGLKKSGYATDPNYSKKLISIIDNYELFKYDRKPIGDSDIEIVDINSKKTEIEVILDTADDTPGELKFSVKFGLKCVKARSGDTPNKIAERYSMHIDRLLSYNKGIDANMPLKKGAIFYMEYKNNFYRGHKKYHIVKKGETLFSISQKYAFTVKYLRTKNRIPENAEPLAGERLSLNKVNLFRRIKYRFVKEKDEFLFED